jgi:hypothetical protein
VRLLGLALDSGVPEHVALSAANSVMDRAGLNAKAEVELSVKPYEAILEQREAGSRAEYRRSVAERTFRNLKRRFPLPMTN